VKPPVRVILITDGDKVARRTMETAAKRLGLRCISASAGNPTPLSGPMLVQLILQAAYDPVLVMVDDKGNAGQGPGETALAYIGRHADVEVLGAIAVASNTCRSRGVPVDVAITRDGRVVECPVDKEGLPHTGEVLKGDTVDVLRELQLPVVVGIGDPGKMHGADCLEKGCEVTTRAIMEVLSRTVGRIPADALAPATTAPPS
jgi:stage V sporulation protein AE